MQHQHHKQGFQNNPYIAENRVEGMFGGVDAQAGMANMNQAMPNANPYYNTMAQQIPITPKTPAVEQPITNSSLLDGFDTNKFLVGALIGAVGAYILTNEEAQKSIFKMAAKGSAMFNAGIEEMKERFEDAKAELEAEQ